jgi:GAF domain-containing protein
MSRSAPVPPDEPERLGALRRLRILDTPPEERFDRITRLARHLFDVPTALITLVDADRQWFKSCVGLEIAETPRGVAFCAYTILRDEPLVIPDARLDPLVADNPFVVGPPHVCFYAGQALRSPEGHRVGTLCIVDVRPRELSPADVQALQDLAALAEAELGRP